MKHIIQFVSERLKISKDKFRQSIFDEIQPIENPSGSLVDNLYDALEAWIRRDQEDNKYDLLRIYGYEDNLPLFNAVYYVSGLNINISDYTIVLECQHINTGAYNKVSHIALSKIAIILGNGDKDKGYGVIQYIINDIDM